MAYQSLEKLFHMDASSARFARNEQLAQERFNAQTTFKTGFASSTGELFVANPPELLCLQEEALVRERAVELLLAKLPRVAQGATVRSLIVDEVVCTNELEGVYSTRRQINELLEQDLHQEKQDKRDESAGQKRFRELARLYLGLSLQPQERLQPACPEDIRKIYDLAMRGEDLGGDVPDGALFRKGRVEVIGAGQKVLHEGLYPESAITQAVQRMLDIVNSNEIPALCGALVGHYLFEYAHPFYDGNGRTGRYLLSLALTRSLSMLTTLSLSRAIAQNRSPYYRAFKEAQSSLNHGELTMFVMTMLGYIRDAQEELVTDLQYKKALLEVVESNITNENDSGIASLTSKQSAILSRLAQQRLFGAFPDVPLIEISDYIGIGTQMARKHVAALEAEGLVETTFKRPLRFALSTEGTRRLGIANA